jgi:hypothetical protein
MDNQKFKIHSISNEGPYNFPSMDFQFFSSDTIRIFYLTTQSILY